ncbi:UDP-glycosyltransferase 85C1-like [Rutidosis leptorrhynchoides]|uniref:UDP-glycosyltransferase 85C1-like n=1 Tax=Rutidosis leptorrhynchoides TaxID=125765 RepID=UPI003A999B5F
METEPLIDQKRPHVVFIPFPAQSHIKCMLKLAKLLHYKGIHITSINTKSSHVRLVKSGGIHDINGVPGFRFKTVQDSPTCDADDDGVEHTPTILELMTYLKENFYDSFLDLVSSLETPVTCIVCDGFMTFTNSIHAAEKLEVPIFLFWTMAACGFMGFYQSKVLVEKGLVPLKDESYLTNGYLEMEIDWIPGMEGIRLKDLPEFIRVTSPNDIAFTFLLEVAQKADNVSHMIFHTFEDLEASLIEEIRFVFPNVYNVGPLQLLLNQKQESKSSEFSGYSLRHEEPECVQWLESKEPNSVVYVNFGSIAVMSLQDLVELGWGLVNSKYEFSWIIRNDLVDGKPSVLPKELEDAINEKGFVGSWCTQEEVLNHRSIGGFLTHGGWGSIIDSLSSGVPMICCPFLGDQLTNCRQMCKKWEIGMEIEKNTKRDEVEKLLRMLMEGEEGKIMRNKALEWKKMAEMATGSCGSSSLDIEKLIDEITNLTKT